MLIVPIRPRPPTIPSNNGHEKQEKDDDVEDRGDHGSQLGDGLHLLHAVAAAPVMFFQPLALSQLAGCVTFVRRIR